MSSLNGITFSYTEPHTTEVAWYINYEVITMTISKDNTRTQLTISKELKKQLEQIAKEQNRSFNNLVITILQSYIGNSSHD